MPRSMLALASSAADCAATRYSSESWAGRSVRSSRRTRRSADPQPGIEIGQGGATDRARPVGGTPTKLPGQPLEVVVAADQGTAGLQRLVAVHPEIPVHRLPPGLDIGDRRPGVMS